MYLTIQYSHTKLHGNLLWKFHWSLVVKANGFDLFWSESDSESDSVCLKVPEKLVTRLIWLFFWNRGPEDNGLKGFIPKFVWFSFVNSKRFIQNMERLCKTMIQASIMDINDSFSSQIFCFQKKHFGLRWEQCFYEILDKNFLYYIIYA